MTYICYRGIEVSARIQYGLLGIELVVLVIFAVYALVKVYAGNAPPGSLHPSLSWLVPTRPRRERARHGDLDRGVHLLGLGHGGRGQRGDQRPDHDAGPGRRALHRCCCSRPTPSSRSPRSPSPASATTGIGLGNPDNADDVFNALGTEVFGYSGFGQLMESLLIISVLTSASASTQTTILPTARTTLSMGAYRRIPEPLRPHPPALPHAERLHDLDGRRLDRVLRRR